MTRIPLPNVFYLHVLAIESILTVDPGVGSESTLRSSPLGRGIAPGSMSSVTVGSRWVNKGDPWGEWYTTSECTGCREEVDPSGEGSHYVYLIL